ncbi:hypothetical protein Tco_0411103 [Tanacetum coccineum]
MPSSLPPFSPSNIRQPPPTAGHSHHRRKSFPATLSGELQIYSSSMDLSDPLLHAPPLILSITTTLLSPPPNPHRHHHHHLYLHRGSGVCFGGLTDHYGAFGFRDFHNIGLIVKIVIIMAQRQQVDDVHQDDLCPPNKRYDIMDANKKVDLENVQCPSEIKILMNIITNHPLRFSIAASASVPWIYMAQFWHTLREDGSKYRLKFMLDRKELTFTLDDFKTIFHLLQANDNNHASFVPPPSFSDMVPFYKQVLGFSMELKTVSNFKIPGLLQPWQMLCKIFSKCLTTRLMWEGIYYLLHHPATLIPYLRFTKIIISHYITIFPDISRRARDAYHNLQDDDIMKNIFNSGRNKNKVGMRIPPWMITEEMKLTKYYKMYADVFGLVVPLIQSRPTEYTQGMHRTLSAPRLPNPATEIAESSVPKRSNVIHFLLPSRQSARLTPPAPVPTAKKADEMIL